MKNILKVKYLRPNLKNIQVWLCLGLLALPLWGKDTLKPEPLQQELKEYNKGFKTGNPNYNNHVIWKLYVYEPIYPERGTPDRLFAGLTSDPQDHFCVMLNINLLWDSLNFTPKAGDVLVVEGHIAARDKNTLVWVLDPTSGDEVEEPKTFLTLFSENAAIWTGEPTPLPPVPGSTSVSLNPGPTIGNTPSISSQGVTNK